MPNGWTWEIARKIANHQEVGGEIILIRFFKSVQHLGSITMTFQVFPVCGLYGSSPWFGAFQTWEFNSVIFVPWSWKQRHWPYVVTPQEKELMFSCYLKKSHASFGKINHPIFYTSKLLGIAREIICSTLESSKSKSTRLVLNLS